MTSTRTFAALVAAIFLCAFGKAVEISFAQEPEKLATEQGVSKPQAPEAAPPQSPAGKGIEEAAPSVESKEDAPAEPIPTSEPPSIEAAPPPAMTAPPYVTALQEGRDLILNRRYEEARKFFKEYGEAHPEDAIGPFGTALVEVTRQFELDEFDEKAPIEPVFAVARASAEIWLAKNPTSTFARWVLGAAEGIQAMWWFKTGSTLKGIPRALSAVNLVESVAGGKNPDPDARGGWGIYLYMRGKYKPFFLPFLDSRKEGKLLLQECRKKAPIMGPLCHLFLLPVNRWEFRWEEVDKLASEFREKYPASPFAAFLQTEARLALKKPEEALQVLRSYAPYDPDSPMLHYWLGRVFWDGLHQAETAQRSWDTAIEKGLGKESKACDAQAGLGEIAVTQKLYAEAELRFTWALRIDSDCPRVRRGSKALAEAKKKKS